MDIANYIGLFLLKNQYCYVHGLGNLELKKRPATFDGKALQSPAYEVLLTTGGSIDDNLANFIATNEQISISKAANSLRDYSIQARKDLAAGKDVPIPNMGRITEQEGKISFITDPNFQYAPAGIPTIRNSKQLEEQKNKIEHKPAYPAPHKADSVNWSMVILVAVLLIIIGAGGYGIYYYTSHRNTSTSEPAKDTVIQTLQMPAPAADTTHLRNDSTIAQSPVAPIDTNAVMPFKMIIGNYPTADRAEKRVHNLSLNGNRVEMVKRDSVDYLVITTINCRTADTAHIEDSLQALFGFKGVATLK